MTSSPHFSFESGALIDTTNGVLLSYLMTMEQTSYAIPDTVTSITSYAFYRNEYIEEVTIPSTVINISGSSFGNCLSLTTVNFEGVSEPSKKCSSSAFEGSSSVTIYVPAEYTGTFCGLTPVINSS